MFDIRNLSIDDAYKMCGLNQKVEILVKDCKDAEEYDEIVYQYLQRKSEKEDALNLKGGKR